jgi:hypothetical protein
MRIDAIQLFPGNIAEKASIIVGVGFGSSSSTLVLRKHVAYAITPPSPQTCNHGASHQGRKNGFANHHVHIKL